MTCNIIDQCFSCPDRHTHTQKKSTLANETILPVSHVTFFLQIITLTMNACAIVTICITSNWFLGINLDLSRQIFQKGQKSDRARLKSNLPLSSSILGNSLITQAADSRGAYQPGKSWLQMVGLIVSSGKQPAGLRVLLCSNYSNKFVKVFPVYHCGLAVICKKSQV